MKSSVFLALIALLSLSSCDKNRVYDQYKSLPNQWNRDSTLVFKVNELDSTQTYNLFINIRNTDDYQFSNIFLITDMIFPQGKVIQDTLEYTMAAPTGQWLGEGTGEVKLSKLWYKEQVQFKEQGSYTFKIRQAMRQNGKTEGIKQLKGITEVGLRIEKTNLTNSTGRE